MHEDIWAPMMGEDLHVAKGLTKRKTSALLFILNGSHLVEIDGTRENSILLKLIITTYENIRQYTHQKWVCSLATTNILDSTD